MIPSATGFRPTPTTARSTRCSTSNEPLFDCHPASHDGLPLGYTQAVMHALVQIRRGQPSAEVAEEKERQLLAELAALPSVIVALSGGIDSAYLAWAAHSALGDQALSVTAISASYSAFDREQVESFLRATGARHEFVETHELENPDYRVNDADRC